MNRRDLLKLAQYGPLALCLRPRVRAEARRVRRSKPFIEGLERGMTRAQIRELENGRGG